MVFKTINGKKVNINNSSKKSTTKVLRPTGLKIKLFTVFAKDRKSEENLDVNSPPPESFFSSRDENKSREVFKKDKKTHKHVTFSEREVDELGFVDA